MEFMENGDLQRYLGSPLPEADAREIAAQLVEGITFMHDNGFAHRDLKPQVSPVSRDMWRRLSRRVARMAG